MVNDPVKWVTWMSCGLEVLHLLYADDLLFLGRFCCTVKKQMDMILDVSREDKVRVSMPKTNIMTVYTGGHVCKENVRASLCEGAIEETEEDQIYLGI